MYYDMAAVCANAEELVAVKKYHGKDGKINMCKAIQDMLEDERQEGIQEGIQVGAQRERQAGLQALIETCQELGMAKEQTVDKVSEKFKISQEKAGEYMQKYWKQ